MTLPQEPLTEQSVQQLLEEWMHLSTSIKDALSNSDIGALNQCVLRRGQCLKSLQAYFKSQDLPTEELSKVQQTLKQYASVDTNLKTQVKTKMTLLQQSMQKLRKSRQQVGQYKQGVKPTSHTRGFA
jgi:ribosomal protein S13